jgi:hypothetical protein
MKASQNLFRAWDWTVMIETIFIIIEYKLPPVTIPLLLSHWTKFSHMVFHCLRTLLLIFHQLFYLPTSTKPSTEFLSAFVDSRLTCFLQYNPILFCDSFATFTNRFCNVLKWNSAPTIFHWKIGILIFWNVSIIYDFFVISISTWNFPVLH